MPTREEMIRDILNAQQAGTAGRAGAAGAALSREQMIQDILDAQPKEAPSSARQLFDSAITSGRSALEMATGGLSEPVFSGINAVSNQTYRALNGQGTDAFSLDNLKKAFQEDVANRRQMKQDYRVADIAGGIGGALAPGTIGAKVATAGAQAAGKGASALANFVGAQRLASNPIAQGAGKIAFGAAQGAGGALASEGLRQSVETPFGFIQPGEAPSLGQTALTGAKFGGAIAGIGPTIDAAKYVGKQVLAGVFGPKVEFINAYLQNADQIRGAKSMEEIKQGIDDTVQMIQDDVDNALITEQQAKEALKAVQNKIKDVTQEANFKFRDVKFDVNEQFKIANQNLQNAHGVQVDSLKAIKSPIQMADDVQTAIVDLKKQVIQGSNEAKEILGNQRAKVDLSEVMPAFYNARERFFIGQNLPIGDSDRQALQRFDELMNRFASINKSGKISALEAKTLIQQLDRDLEYNAQAGSFQKPFSAALTPIRQRLDEILKTTYPAYREKMSEVADKTNLLSEVSDRFGDPRSTVSKLNSIAGRTAGEDRAILEKLGLSTGRDFKTPVDQFASAQSTLKDPNALERMKRGLPEFKQSKLAEFARNNMTTPRAQQQFVDTEIGKSGLLPQADSARGNLSAAQSDVQQIKAVQEPFRTITKETSQGKIKALMGSEKNIEVENKLRELGKLSDRDFIQEINDLRVKRAFESENRRGSGNINLWALVGKSAGGAAVGLMSGDATLTAVGAVFGAISDRFGPRMTKAILDGVLKIQGSPTIQKIKDLGLPPDATNYLTQSLIREQAALQQGSGAARQVSDEDNALQRRLKARSVSQQQLHGNGGN